MSLIAEHRHARSPPERVWPRFSSAGPIPSIPKETPLGGPTPPLCFLLQVVQVLTDLNLIITKAYTSSDVFNVTDHDGNKVWDNETVSCIQTSLESDACFFPALRSTLVGMMPSEEHTIIELMGNDRPGLLSEICAVLTDLNCNVVKAEVWTHNTRAAAVVHVTYESTAGAIEDPQRLSTVKELLCNVLKGDNTSRSPKMMVSTGLTHTARRLHQMMFDDRDYEE